MCSGRLIAGWPVMLYKQVNAAIATISPVGPAEARTASRSPAFGGSMAMVGVTRRSNSSSNRRTTVREKRARSEYERTMVRLSTLRPAL